MNVQYRTEGELTLTPKTDVSDHRRQQVIDAAIRCMVENGLLDFSVKDIAAEAGVSTGILYHYFDNKDDILLKALGTVFAATDEEFRQVVARAEPGPDRLDTYLTHAAALARHNPEIAYVLFSYLGQVKRDPAVRDKVARFFRNLRHYVAELLLETGSDGRDGDNLAEKERTGLAALILGVNLGLAVQWIVDPEAVDLTDAGERLKDIVHRLITPRG